MALETIFRLWIFDDSENKENSLLFTFTVQIDALQFDRKNWEFYADFLLPKQNSVTVEMLKCQKSRKDLGDLGGFTILLNNDLRQS